MVLIVALLERTSLFSLFNNLLCLKTSILGHPGLHFGTLWPPFWWPGSPRDPLGTLSGNRPEFETFSGPNWNPCWAHFGTKIRKGRKKHVNKCYPGGARKKVAHPTPPEAVQYGSRTINSICLARLKSINEGGFWLSLGYPLGSLLAILAHTWAILAEKRRLKQIHENLSPKRGQNWRGAYL